MRQLYTSPRIENVNRVVALLNEQGIETSVTNRCVYHTRDWKRFSYTERSERDAWPQVWVVRAEDQTRARALLREIGLEPATRFADELAAARGIADTIQHRSVSMRWRLVLLALIAGVALLILFNGSI